ncbi:MAG: pseudouridine-5'-phosphate glycosidase, partial [Cellulomonas sp.]|nr:pseudouridine-5'-phosphate glycosidase [Cellulomonas sp.]
MTAVAEAREVAAQARAERAALAWEALARAELRTGARSVRAAPAAPSAVPSVPAADDEPARPAALITAERPPMAVPPALAPLLPEGLRRGGTTAVTGSTSLVLALLAHACAHGAWVAVVGRPDLGVLARTPVAVVCSGVKSILDVGATLEVLETDSVGVLGYGTDAF